MNVLAFTVELRLQYIWTGISLGMVYALLAIGIVLIYKASGIINFAQGQIGSFGSVMMAMLYVRYDIPYGISLPLAILSGAALGAITELLVVRRLFRQPRLILFIATLGMSQVILLLTLQLPTVFQVVEYPTLSDWRTKVGSVIVRADQLTAIAAVVVITIVLAYLLQRTRFGLAVRAAADNANAASLAGISVKSVSTQVWVIAGVLSTVSAIVSGPLLNQNASDVGITVGPALLLKGLAAALFGRFISFPWAFAGGLIIGVVEQVILQSNSSSGIAGLDTAVVFVLVVILVAVRGRATRGDDTGWAMAPRLRGGSLELARLPAAKWLRWSGFGVLGAVAVALPFLLDKPTDQDKFATVLLYMIVAISATVLSGWAGQLSMGQFAFVGLGAFITSNVAMENGLRYWLAVLVGVAVGVAAAIVVGIPALRIRGLYLAIITLAGALMAHGFLLQRPWLSNNIVGTGAALDSQKLWFIDLDDSRSYYLFCLAVLCLVAVLAHRLRHSGIGRTLIAVRDNEPSAAAYTVSPVRAKLIAFAVSGGFAALAGALLAAKDTITPIDLFTPNESLRIVAIAVVGGISSILGAVLGTIIVIGIPTIFDGTTQVQLFASGIGMLALLLYFPTGLIGLFQTGRDLFVGWLARKYDLKPPPRQVGATVASLVRAKPSASSTATPLQTRDVTVRFGGRVAVDNVSINVQPGEIVGLIGTNGAGKTTFMNAVSGFVPSSGTVEVYGATVSGSPAHRRARLGLGRAFQNAKLFSALTVRETLLVALEARQRSLLIPSMFMLPPSPRAEARKRREADEIISYLGLGRYADALISELSTGTRRIVELGALMALDTRLMLLDEPTAGVAQRETEAFGPLIKTIQKELGSSILIIEHDMPMVMSISDRIYCLEAGAVIAEGSPTEVRNNPLVIASYLGTDERAIQRSGTAAKV